MRLLLVEDEPLIAKSLRRALEAEGHSLRHVTTLTAARAALSELEPDLIVLDISLPDDPDAGFKLAQEARAAGFAGAILFMTARDALDDRVHGLDLGGDDYVVKPFELREFMARVRALLRRQTETRSSLIERGPFSLDLNAKTVRWEGKRISLSSREYDLLERLALSPNRVYQAEELIDLIWGDEASNVGVVKVYVHHLRQKIAPEVVRTERGGYCFGVEA